MQDIRLVGNDGEYLNLETQGGDKYRLVLDDSLRSAVKRDLSVQLDAIAISPREIQDAVRAGSTAEEVSEQNSVPLDYVQKFALTVVDEIGHIIASAQSVRIAVEADRYSDASQVEFGEVIAERISSLGGSDISWSAAKHEGLPWQVSVSYQSNAGAASARWSFDQRKLVLSPENELAIKISAGEVSASSASPKLRPLDEVFENTQVIDLTPEVTQAPPAPSDSPALRVVSSIEELTKASVEAAEATAQPVDFEIENRKQVVPEPQDEPLSATADLLEALRKKRADATKAQPVEDAEIESSDAGILEVEPEAIVAPAKKGRPSMPSWDEIVFGTKTED
jgi:hypothetical protein